ncbi:MAG: PIG-L family deacetylase [Bryobacteraceae bacterium]|jgi:LmbE family N-acetylglucosaminyl deacetylase
MLSLRFRATALLLLAAAVASAQPNLSGAAEVRLALGRLNVLGSALMIGAHPDDEHTPTLAWLARGRLMRAAYVSITRGEGGQNLLGPEQGDLLGLIRTEELLAARRIDGAEQFFTRAIDFGFSKSPQETFDKWGHEAVLADLVWIIRRFRPDVIILCFSGTARDGHGHHQASALLGKEAFSAASDPSRFPEQLKWVEPWQAKRAVWNVYGRPAEATGQVTIETGDYNPVLGYSYIEIAGLSRSMHASQGMGSPRRRGAATTSLVPVAGEPASKDLFDGIDTTWSRVPGGAEVGRILAQAARSLDPAQPERVVPLLLDARKRMAVLKDPWAERKRAELDEAVALCAGLWLDASTDRSEFVPGSTMTVRTTALNRSRLAIRLLGISLDRDSAMDVELPFNQPSTRDFTWKVPEDAKCSQPYWLAEPRRGDAYGIPDQQLTGMPENPPVLRARFRLRVASDELELTRPVLDRYVDRLRGEFTRPVIIVPPVALEFSEPVVMFPDRQPKRVEVALKSNIAGAAGEVRLEAPDGWRVEPASRKFQFGDGEQMTLAFEVAPPASAARGRILAHAWLGERRIGSGMQVVAYPHIRPQAVFPPSAVEAVRADIRVLAKRIGYVMGAGDEVPQALRQLGCEVTLLTADDLAASDLARFDAIVTGVRAYNVRPDLRANQHRLLDYVQKGGTLVVQYNVLDYGASPQTLEKIGPYPIRIGRDRVSVEEAPVSFPDPASPLLRKPNRITAADFDGWVQERGLYFPSEWDPRYRTLLESHDPGETPKPGGTLYVPYGKGTYVFTAYSWFRQLPAGVPGAFRVFANLLSAGKAVP